MLTRNRKDLSIVLLLTFLLTNSLLAEIFHSKDLDTRSKAHLLEAINFNKDLPERLKAKKTCELDYYILPDPEYKKVSHGLSFQAFYSNKKIYLPESLAKRQRDLIVSIRHENIHALLDCEYKKPIPVWLDEGLAYYFSDSIKNLKPLHSKALFPLNTISNSFSKLSPKQRKIAYLQSKYLIKYLFKITNLGGIKNYLSLLDKGQSEAFKKAFAISQSDFERNFRSWLKYQK